MKLLKTLTLAAMIATAITTTTLTTPSYAADPIELLNVSYDPTREFYDEFNKLFITHWKEKSGQDITVNRHVQ